MEQQPKAKRVCTSRSATTTIIPDTNSPPALLRLPRELRDNIYEYCVSADGGYIYDPDTDSLKQANGSPISLSLAFVNRQIRSEFEALPLKLNAITFTSAFSAASRRSAAIHKCIVHKTISEKKSLVSSMISQLLTPEMAQTIAMAFPQFAPIVDGWMSGEDDAHTAPAGIRFSCGEAPSIWHDFIHYVYVRLTEHPDFASKTQKEDDRDDTLEIWCFQGYKFSIGRALELSRHHPDPWKIFNDTELKKLAPINRFKPTNPYYYPHMRYGYSAAALALRFLNSLPQKTRQFVRNIILKEDRESVSFPACHGRGFIALCQENPKLRVCRFADLWKCVFSVGTSRISWIRSIYKGLGSASVAEHEHQLLSNDITQDVGEWLTEASILPSLGMPEGSYRLVLDGGPTPEYTSSVFQTVHRDVAWHQALDHAYARGYLPTPSWITRRTYGIYRYQDLAEIVGKISRTSQLIRCNFDPGSSQDPETLVEDHRGWSFERWGITWELLNTEVPTQAPLPPWHELRYDNVLNEER